MLTAGAAMHPCGDTRGKTVSLVVSLPSGSTPSRQYLQYISRRVVVAIGRDPDRHVVACAHTPDRHPTPGADGQPIQPHVHITIATFDPLSGEHWRCPHLHIVIQRELAAIDLERPVTSSAAPAVAGGKKLGLLCGPDRLKCRLESVDGTTRTISLDSAAIVAAKAAIGQPHKLEVEPASGLVVTRPAITPERTLTQASKLAVPQILAAREEIANSLGKTSISGEDCVWAATAAEDAAAEVVAVASSADSDRVAQICAIALRHADGDAARAYALMAEIAYSLGNAVDASHDYDKG
jgi:hypothetical protein